MSLYNWTSYILALCPCTDDILGQLLALCPCTDELVCTDDILDQLLALCPCIIGPVTSCTDDNNWTSYSTGDIYWTSYCLYVPVQIIYCASFRCCTTCHSFLLSWRSSVLSWRPNISLGMACCTCCITPRLVALETSSVVCNTLQACHQLASLIPTRLAVWGTERRVWHTLLVHRCKQGRDGSNGTC